MSQLLDVGKAVRLRHRLAVVQRIRKTTPDSAGKVRHVVDVEYLDNETPQSDQVLWELEPDAEALETVDLPRIENRQHVPDDPSELRAFVHAHCWTRLQRVRDHAPDQDQIFASIPSSSLQVHPYQLVPLLRALRMPRVNLLLADGVGLGKTIEAGLVLQELLLRRRVRRILIVCPAMLQEQWRDELQRKFQFSFDIMDADRAYKLRRQMGTDTNPWRTHSRWITSMDYLRQEIILHQFESASRPKSANGHASPTAPWDLLIVDECHNAAPAGPSRASLRYEMLRRIRFLFEHRVFLSATPHNGNTISFTGLLELLDPVRFQMKTKWTDDDRANLNQVKVRRLKQDLKDYDLQVPMSDEMQPREEPLTLSDDEVQLYAAMRSYRLRGLERLETIGSSKESWVAQFVFQILTKRLLSCPFAFARTWWRHVDRTILDAESSEESLDKAAQAASRAKKADLDEERSTAEEDATQHGGAWLYVKDKALQSLQDTVSQALTRMGLGHAVVFYHDDDIPDVRDTKTQSLIDWIRANMLHEDDSFVQDERLIVFTEYKETLTYLLEQFRREGWGGKLVETLVGGMDRMDFQRVRERFEDESSNVRILLATDAASEGINLQEACRWVFHFDIPWSPTKLQQRNGRVWRHGQTREVTARYFKTDQVEDLKFLLKVARKVQSVNRELGSIEPIFDKALYQDFKGHHVDWDIVEADVDSQLKHPDEEDELPKEDKTTATNDSSLAHKAYKRTRQILGVQADGVQTALSTAMALDGGGEIKPKSASRPGRFSINLPRRWQALFGDSLALNKLGARPDYLFDPNAALVERHGMKVFRLDRREVLLRLGHPLIHHALSSLKGRLYASAQLQTGKSLSRWTIGAHDLGDQGNYLLLHAVLLAQNGFHDAIHDEVISTVFTVIGDSLEETDAITASKLMEKPLLKPNGAFDRIKDSVRKRWLPHSNVLRTWLDSAQATFDTRIRADAAQVEKHLADMETKLYRDRLKSLSDARQRKQLETLAREKRKLETAARQTTLDLGEYETTQQQLEDVEAEIQALERDMDDLRTKLEQERDYRLKTLIPKRFEITSVYLFPLAVEYAVPFTGGVQ